MWKRLVAAEMAKDWQKEMTAGLAVSSHQSAAAGSGGAGRGSGIGGVAGGRL